MTMLYVLNIYIFAILFANIIICFGFDCFLYDNDYKCKLGTKTPYRFIANHNDSILNYPGCTERKMWLVVRHGTRYPGKKDLPRMASELPKLQKIILDNYKLNKVNLTLNDIEQLARWKVNFTSDDVMKLDKEGEEEMIDLGERYQSRFPSLMPAVYSNETYKFKYTATQRTEESAKHFAIGLFGWHGSQKILYPEPEDKDPVLRFYKRCTRWSAEVDKNPTAYKEKEEFLQSSIFIKALQSISERIGHQLDSGSLKLIYNMCGFETAWNEGSESPWCKLFSIEDFKILEFAEDLEYYWIDGYGYRLTYEQACAALTDMFDTFISKDDPTVTAYFTHSGTILKLLALLGVAKDSQPLTRESFLLHSNMRLWKTSIIDAFATNIAFILYDCASGPSILLMHQERPVYLPGCPENAPCPLSTMKNIYPDRDEECPFDAMCSINASL